MKWLCFHEYSNTYFVEDNGKVHHTSVVCNIKGSWQRHCKKCSKRQRKISIGNVYGIFFGDGKWVNI